MSYFKAVLKYDGQETTYTNKDEWIRAVKSYEGQTTESGLFLHPSGQCLNHNEFYYKKKLVMCRVIEPPIHVNYE
jgi:hypothetical protein